MSIRLADFLRQHRHGLLEAWEAEVRRQPAAQGLDTLALKDHLPTLLEWVTDWLSRPHADGAAGVGSLSDTHALERLGEGFDLRQVVMECRVLRGCVLRQWRAHGGSPDEDAEAEPRFHEALDEAVAASVNRYARQRERALRALDRISAAALDNADLATFLPRLLEVLRETVPMVDSVAVLLREGEAMRVAASVGLPGEDTFHVRVGEGFSGTIAATGQPLLVRDVASDARVQDGPLRQGGIRAVYGVPLVLEGRVLGVAHMGSRASHEFSSEDMLLFRTMASRATALIAQVQSLARERAARAEAEASLARLRETEAGLRRWEDIFRRLGAGVVLVDAATEHIVDVNPAYARMHGWTREEMLGRPVLEFIAPESRGAMPLHVAAAHSKPHHEFEVVRLRRDGSRFSGLVNTTTFRDAQGRVALRVSTLIDVSHRRAAEAERQRLLATLESERARLSAVLEELPAGVLIAEAPSGQLVMTNRRVEEILGHPFQASGGVAGSTPDFRGFHPDGRPYAAEEWPMARALLQGEGVVGEEIEMVREDGTRCVVLTSGAPIRDREGHIVAGVVTMLDVTERRRVEDAARQAARFGERLIAIVSHDLRNPLNAIHLSATQLLRSEALAARERRSVTRIDMAAERMRRMISELLDFTRGRLGGGIPVQPQAMDFRQVVRQGVEELEAAWPERSLRLRVGEGDFQGEGDAERLAQVVSNLGGNALQYSPAEQAVTFTLTRAGTEVVLEVHNAGAPIPPEALPRLFDPFRRATSETGTGGLGLGLYIVEQVVKGHGGHIDVTSTAEAGTTFRVTLPRVAQGQHPH